jgi:Tfp pilus assembly protein PilW
MARYRKIREEAGVSLMEAMVALFLTGLVVAAVVGADF